MKTTIKFCLFLLFLALWFASPAPAQSPIMEIRAVGEHRMFGATASDTTRQLARMAGRRNALREAVSMLLNTAEMKDVPLKADEVLAILPTLVETRVESESAVGIANAMVFRVDVLATVRPSDIARRLDKIRKDPAAIAGLMEISRQTNELAGEIANLPAGAEARESREKKILDGLNAKLLVAHVYASLAKTEESPGSKRVVSVSGRQRAMRFAEMAVTVAPELPEAHLALGDALMNTDQPPVLAETAYRQALLLKPDSSKARIKLAEVLRLDGRLQDAISELREALRLEPASAEAHNDLGFILGAQQSTSAAVTEFEEALRLKPDFIDALNNLAIALARQGRIPDAVVQFRKIVSVDPDSVLGYYNLGIALADMDEDAASAEAFRNAVRVNPNHYNSRFNIGELFRLDDKFDEAVKQFREYIRLAPDTPQNQRNITRAREFVETHENR